jgi:hypothetical protein
MATQSHHNGGYDKQAAINSDDHSGLIHVPENERPTYYSPPKSTPSPSPLVAPQIMEMKPQQPVPYQPSYYSNNNQQQFYQPQGGEAPEEKKILGMRKTTFWLALVSGFLLVGIIVVAAVAGSMAAKNNSNNTSGSSSGAQGYVTPLFPLLSISMPSVLAVVAPCAK